MRFVKVAISALVFSVAMVTSANSAPVRIEIFGTLFTAQTPLNSSFSVGESGKVTIFLADDTPDQIFSNIYRYNVESAEFVSDSYSANTASPLNMVNYLDVFNDATINGTVVDFFAFISTGPFNASPIGLFELSQVNSQAYFDSSLTDGPLPSTLGNLFIEGVINFAFNDGMSGPVAAFDVTNVTITYIPLPAAAWLMGVGIIGLRFASRKKRRTAYRNDEITGVI